MSVNKRQIAQISVAAAALILFIVRLCTPGWDAGKILGIIIPILIILSMVLSFIAEEQRKRKQ